jgi:protein-tyrosine phosphatase
MKKIMFVCHGNICRSPMAEFIFKKMIDERGLSNRFTVASSATSREEIVGDLGNPVYPPARAELLRHGIDPEGKRAVQITPEDYEKYDLLITMDTMNVRNLMRIIESDPERKVKKLMDFTPRGGDVADPWYTGDFATTYRDIYDGCSGLLEYLTK